MPTDEELDTMTAAQAEEWLERLYEESPEVVAAIESFTLIASPLAGPVRILREVVEGLR